MLSHLDMAAVREHYRHREKLHLAMEKAFTAKNITPFLQIALGISDPAGNYSASEYKLGEKILATNAPHAVFALAEKLKTATPKNVVDIINAGNVSNLKISVGSELSMMLQPTRLWTANVRTVWAHLLIAHNDNYEVANEALKLYRTNPGGKSEMAYNVWVEIHPELRATLTRLHDAGVEEAQKQGVQPGTLKFLWADAIANELYQLRPDS